MATVEKDLHEYAVSAEESLSDLTTGLALEGADPDVIETVRRMAAVMRRIIRALGPAPEQEAPPAAEPAPQEPAPQAGPQEAAQPASIDAATRHLHQSMQAAAAARQGGQ